MRNGVRPGTQELEEGQASTILEGIKLSPGAQSIPRWEGDLPEVPSPQASGITLASQASDANVQVAPAPAGNGRGPCKIVRRLAPNNNEGANANGIGEAT